MIEQIFVKRKKHNICDNKADHKFIIVNYIFRYFKIPRSSHEFYLLVWIMIEAYLFLSFSQN